jgi:hypothetical protein
MSTGLAVSAIIRIGFWGANKMWNAESGVKDWKAEIDEEINVKMEQKKADRIDTAVHREKKLKKERKTRYKRMRENSLKY